MYAKWALSESTVAVGAKDGELCMADVSTGNVGGLAVTQDEGGTGGMIECDGNPHASLVPLKPLSKIVQELEAKLGKPLPPPAVFKVDCEGCEWLVTEGAIDLFERNKNWRPKLIVMEALTEFLLGVTTKFAEDGSEVNTLHLLQKYIPYGYTIWTGDLLHEITDNITPSSGAEQYTAEELDRQGMARACPVYVLHHGPRPTDPNLWSTMKGCHET